MERKHQKNRSIKSVLLSWLIVMALLILPDVIFSLINGTFKVSRDPKTVLFLAPLAFGLVTSPKWFSTSVLLFFGVLQTFQFAHIAYFGVHLTPFALQLMETELPDVIAEVQHLWLHYLYIPFIIFIPFYLIYRLRGKINFQHQWIGIVAIFAIFARFEKRLYQTQRYLPNSRRITLDNSLRVFCGYIDKKNSSYVFKTYKPYSVVRNDHFQSKEAVNIVYIIGESCNYRHMSLFGYDVNDTTPRLKNLSKDPNFYYTIGISGASATFASSKVITNAIREPDNVVQGNLDATNLFKLAKQSGFETFYLSTQCDSLLSNLGGASYIDHISTKESAPLQIAQKKDLYLLELLKKQDFKDKNFIVLHQSSVHTPYEWTYGKGYKPETVFSGQEDSRLDQYDNAMLYNDLLISEMFNFFNKSKKPYYIIWASDHSELFGEGGAWGHGSGVLVPEVSQIPVIIQTNDQNFNDRVRNTFAITHYEIAKLIAERIGFDIINPNEADEPNIFYTNGNDCCGKAGYIRYEKNLKNHTIKYDPPHYP